MPEFILNESAEAEHPFYALNEFAKGYVEAMFFTNCDCGDDNEHLANELGTEALTVESVAKISAYCAAFERDAAALLEQAYQGDYSEEQAGRDLWFTAQGHGVGFWGRSQIGDELGEALSELARQAGERYVEIYERQIHY